MKTFEEKWTAWLDGQLSGKELSEFEALLPDRAAAEAEKKGAHQLGTLLKRELGADVLTNEDFFNHQIGERIAGETPDQASEPEEAISTWWTLRRLFWTGTAALAAFVIFAVVIMQNNNVGGPSDLTTQVINARVDVATSPDGSITPFESKQDRVTVLWTEGLKSLPSDYAAK
jgi:anti-sigma factor RsiW